MSDTDDELRALARAFSRANSLLFVLEGDGRVRLASEPAKALVGEGGVCGLALAHDDLTVVAGRVLASGMSESVEATYVRPDASMVHLQGELSAFDRASGLVLLVAVDVTARRKVEERLRRSEAMLVDAQGVAHLGTWEWDVTEAHATWSDELYRIYALDKATYTPSYEAYLEKVHPDDREHVRIATERVFREHVPYSHDERIHRPDGSIRYLHTWAFPVLDDQGKLTRLVGVCQDITDRKLAEMAFAEQEKKLRHAHKFEAMGRLTSGIAHDFNNLLTAILAHANIIERATPQPEPVRASLAKINMVARQGARLTNQLVSFGRVTRAGDALVDLRRVIADMVEIFARALGSKIHLVTKCSDDGPFVLGDRGQLDQVIMNLVVNAGDAMPRGGRLLLEIVPMSEVRDSLPDEIGPAESFVVIRVTDEGVGMDESVQARIFDPYFTTKETGHGLGLATVYGIVRQCGGAITVKSAPNEGACFQVFLPRAAAPSAALEERQPA